ncbi:hypothetical protein DFH07DRAFT_114984 [Mycena maculata]|uniref:Uncharacterized protein n=1 Tax=Mycena maculata TaxID=230809 RepID=A0AAD7I4Y9_9AGAR|nr:hypothetical protein DFH07DRAFT_114984 [Mycena maculata]
MKPNSSQNLTSASFMKIYNSLPPEARQSLVERKLAPLLDSVPREKAKKVLKSANILQSRYSDIPVLDLKAKKAEINVLLEELARDSKRAIVRERSNRDELLAEIVDSLVDWLNDIWTVVYDYNVHFEEAHACLLFVAETLNTLSSIPGIGGPCRCSIAHLNINIAIRRKGKTIKKFSLASPRNIDRALLWIWRDLFISMFAKGKHTEKIPDMLSDIAEYLEWQALERMLYGGSSPRFDEDEYDPDAFMEACLEDDDEDEDESLWHCPCRLHGSHWSDTINEQRTELRDLVHKHLLSLFEVTPSHQIFTSIILISPDSEETEAELLDTLSQIAGSSADTLVAALDIHGSEGNAAALMTLLDEHVYLLRPRDAHVLQAAVRILSDFNAFHGRAVRLAEKELLDTVTAVRAAVHTMFPHVEDKAPAAALAEITKLRSDNPYRHQRIDTWIDSVIAPGPAVGHPMAFAAMIMGLPIATGLEDGDDMDMLGYLDMDSQRDPDLEDLRDEFRPKLRERFEGWVSMVSTMKGGGALLGRVYLKVMEEMPYFKVNDVAEEMLNRVAERPGKGHITDAIDSLLTFSKTQRKKIAARLEKRRKTEAKKASTGSSAATPPAPAPPPTHITQRSGFPFSFITTSHPAGPAAGPSSGPFPAGSGIGGMEDVD